MESVKEIRPISVEEYLDGEKLADTKHEFVDGEVQSMVGVSEAHNLISGAFYNALSSHLRGTSCRTFFADVKLRVGDNFYYPDVFVTCDRADNDPSLKSRPVLIVEVLSPGTAIRDSHEKLLVYRTIASLREYVLAEQGKREVRVHRRVGDGWETATYAGDASIELASVNLTLPLDAIYAGIL